MDITRRQIGIGIGAGFVSTVGYGIVSLRGGNGDDEEDEPDPDADTDGGSDSDNGGQSREDLHENEPTPQPSQHDIFPYWRWIPREIERVFFDRTLRYEVVDYSWVRDIGVNLFPSSVYDQGIISGRYGINFSNAEWRIRIGSRITIYVGSFNVEQIREFAERNGHTEVETVIDGYHHIESSDDSERWFVSEEAVVVGRDVSAENLALIPRCSRGELERVDEATPAFSELFSEYLYDSPVLYARESEESDALVEGIRVRYPEQEIGIGVLFENEEFATNFVDDDGVRRRARIEGDVEEVLSSEQSGALVSMVFAVDRWGDLG